MKTIKHTKLNLKTLMAVLAATVWIAVAGTGCKHTAEGVGEDMERAGEKIQDKVD